MKIRHYVFLLVTFAWLLAGCMVSTGQRPSSRSIYNWEEEKTTQTTGPARTAAQTQEQAMAAPQPRSVPQAPYEVSRRPLGASAMYETQIQAPDNMSVKVSNPTGFWACLHSPLVGGVPVLRERYGNYEQDFVPSHPGWGDVRCTAVIPPNPGQYDRDAPEVWLATERRGTYKMWATFYTYFARNPELVPESTFAVELTFPNTPRTNGGCMAGSAKGCLYNVLLQAANFNLSTDQALAMGFLQQVDIAEDPYSMLGHKQLAWVYTHSDLALRSHLATTLADRNVAVAMQ